ncbi:hypothetical protein EJ02DRAFT_451510 [Clathrospora elynae]|uniref:Uncharacterized protein n=1 Tax=Clathrospora elynae TaxID=706981 RepID=A0A6A5SZP4_9PLEO|nr:hypothetical protein EJ02DRAFT_451510 [Clathrospora elynae]
MLRIPQYNRDERVVHGKTFTATPSHYSATPNGSATAAAVGAGKPPCRNIKI